MTFVARGKYVVSKTISSIHMSLVLVTRAKSEDLRTIIAKLKISRFLKDINPVTLVS